MSYCRFAWYGSDVYVYPGQDGIECCGCRLKRNPDSGAWFTCATPEEMIAHLVEHKKAGDFVPLFAIERLWSEIDGPNEAVRPEPPEMTKAREMMDKAREELEEEAKNANRTDIRD